jgi:antitoxin component of MazEF toxin-antitoxin module
LKAKKVVVLLIKPLAQWFNKNYNLIQIISNIMKPKQINITPSITYVDIMEEKAITRKIGGSLVATIPKKIVNKLELRENEKIIISIEKEKKDFFGIFSGKVEFTEEDRKDERDN